MILSRTSFVLGALLLCVGLQCAHQVTPGGGPADVAAPSVVGTTPSAGQLRVARDAAIELEFSEWISPQKAAQAVTMFPPPSKGFDVQVRGRTLQVKPRSDLADSTTYHLEITSAMQDLRGNSLGSPFRLVFSTGSSLDSGGISGCVIDPVKRLLQPKVVLARADSALSDSALLSTVTYMAQTDSGGLFTVEHVRPGQYGLFAFEDANNDGRFQPDREQCYVAEQRQVAVTAGKLNVMLYPARSDTTTRRVVSCSPVNSRVIAGTWNRQAALPPSNSPPRIRVMAGDSTGHVPGVARYVPRSGGKDFLLLLSEPLKLSPYWLRYEREPVLPLSDSVSAVDSLRLNGTVAEDTAAPRLLSPRRVNQVELEPTLSLAWSEPVRFAAPALQLSDSLGDTVALRADTGFVDTTRFYVARRLQPGRSYTLSFSPTDILDLNGLHLSDTTAIQIAYSTMAADSICVSLAGLATCSSSVSNRVWIYAPFATRRQYQASDRNGRFRFDSIPGGRGTIAWFVDRDRDGEHDGGQLAPFVAPEPYVALYDTVEARARWDIDGLEVGVCDPCVRGQLPRRSKPDSVSAAPAK
jgi:hypothetical protein